jgi:hypothetical protein
VNVCAVVVTTPPVTTVMGQVPAVAFFGIVAVNVVDDTNTVGIATPLAYTTDCLVKPTPVTAVNAVVPVPDTAVVGAIVVSVGLVTGLRLEACCPLGPPLLIHE